MVINVFVLINYDGNKGVLVYGMGEEQTHTHIEREIASDFQMEGAANEKSDDYLLPIDTTD